MTKNEKINLVVDYGWVIGVTSFICAAILLMDKYL